MPTLRIYNLANVGVDIDTDNVHAPTGGFRRAQNIHPDIVLTQAASIITRKGLRNLNLGAIAGGPILGGVAIPAFELGNGVPILFLGFGVE